MKLALIAIALLLLFNTAIAGLLTVIEFGQGFWINLLFSQCIGCCIALVNSPLILRLEPGWQRWLGRGLEGSFQPHFDHQQAVQIGHDG